MHKGYQILSGKHVVNSCAKSEKNAIKKTLADRIQSEMLRYLSEPEIDIETDILDWWMPHENTYPLMSQCAKMYYRQF